MSVKYFSVFSFAYFSVAFSYADAATCEIGGKFGFFNQNQIQQICRQKRYCSTFIVNGQNCADLDPRKKSKTKSVAAKQSNGTIRQVQESLNGLGFNSGKPDGIYGSKTDRALKEFYRTIGKTYDGRVSFNELEDIRLYKNSDVGRVNLIKAAQRKLNQLGFNAGAADGVYGNNTKSAITEFYTSIGKTYDGYLDSRELTELNAYQNSPPKRKKIVIIDAPKVDEQEILEAVEIDLTS